MLSVVKGVEPKDQVEAMLAAQMAAVHTATMAVARKLSQAANIQEQDSVERAFNKLARTFAKQIEALKRYRTVGEQKVNMQNVSVHDGGQAIVGNVTQAPAKNAYGTASIIRRWNYDDASIRQDRRARRWSPPAKSITMGHPRDTGRCFQAPGAVRRPGLAGSARHQPCRGRRVAEMHGGASDSGAPPGNQNATKHGLYAKQNIEARRPVQALLRSWRDFVQKLKVSNFAGRLVVSVASIIRGSR
jgi:hypothetical protein